MARTGHLPMSAIAKVKTTAERGSRWLKRRFSSRRGSQASTDTRTLSIGPPTDFRHQELILGKDVDGSNSLLIQQAREDAQNMHKGARMEKMKRHARKLSVNFGTAGEGISFERDLHM